MLYRFQTKTIKRTNNESAIGRAGYITGKTLHDYQKGKDICRPRNDVAWQNIFLPNNAPPEYTDLQTLANAMEQVETRCNARTARQYTASLPNELPKSSLIQITTAFIEANFISRGLCVIAAMHEGKNSFDAKNNNPHVHLLVSTRPIDGHSFSRHKDRVLDSRSNLLVLRSRWADILNHEYEHFHLPYRVSPEKQYAMDHECDHNHDFPVHIR